jgi:hypothetical protein
MIIEIRNDRDSIVSSAKRNAWPRMTEIIERMIAVIRPMILTRMSGQTGNAGMQSRNAAR